MPSFRVLDTAGEQGASPYFCTPQQLQSVATLVGGDSSVATQVCSIIDVGSVGATNAVLQWTVRSLNALENRSNELENGLNTQFLLASAYQVFIMQAGFALFAAGVVRAKNVHMILLKNFMDAAVASITFYCIGYGLAFGDNGSAGGFIGNSDFALSDTSQQNPQPYASWFWNWAFAAASTTILSGSIAERATFHAYLIYSFLMTIWVYPVVAHWIWSPVGWLSAHNTDAILGSGTIDFSGSGVVHMVGGFASIMGSLATGPRTGRFDSSLPVTAFKGHSAPLYVLGTMLLWFGWYGFNPGSHLGISSYVLSSGVSRTAVTTTLSAGAGAITALLLVFKRTRTWDLLQACTGSLAGLVAVTAGCGVITPWAAIICGVVAAPIYVYGDAWMEWMQIDDPVGAFPMHGLCGCWGLIFVGLLGNETYIVQVYGKPYGDYLMGIFYGGHGQLLLCQFIAVLVIAAWSAFWIGSLFFGMRWLGILRVPLEQEAQGLDSAACGNNGSVNPKSMTKFSSNGMELLTMGNFNTLTKGGLSTPQVRANGMHAASLVTITEGSISTGVADSNGSANIVPTEHSGSSSSKNM